MSYILSFLSDRERSLRSDLLLLLLLFGGAFFLFLGSVPLIDPDEGRYAEIPREMLERGDFVTPFLNYVKYFEKPPLHYWLNAGSFALFGKTEFAARFPGALLGLGTVLLTYCLGRTLYGRREGVLAALILGTSTGFVVQARLNFTDMTLTFCMAACLGFFLLAMESTERKGLFYHIAYVFAALAVLAKGLIGIVLPGGVLFVFLLITRRWRLLREMRLASGTLLFFAVASPWFIAVSARNPEFARFFFIHEHFERFLTTVHGRYQPFWFFIPVLAMTMLPWSLFIPVGVKGVWRERALPGGVSRLYLFVWAAVIFLFFSKSNSKLIPYILPVFPPLALLIGSALTRASERMTRGVKATGYAGAALFSLVGVAVVAYPHLARHSLLPASAGAIVGTLFVCEGIFCFAAARRGHPLNLFISLVTCSYLIGIVAPPLVLSRVAEEKSLKWVGLAVKESVPPDAVVASFGLMQGLPFYAERRIVVVGLAGETEFGSKQGIQTGWFLTIPAFIDLWNSSTPVFVAVEDWELPILKKTLRTVPRVVVESEGKALLANH